MPFKWTPEADLKFIAAILQLCDVKLNKEMVEKINEIMGPECKDQAVNRRFSKYKNIDLGLADASVAGTPTKPSSAAAAAAAAAASGSGSGTEPPETPKRGRGRPSKAKKDAADGEADGNGEAPTPADTPKRKRGRPPKVKIEEGVGEGGVKGAREEEGEDREQAAKKARRETAKGAEEESDGLA